MVAGAPESIITFAPFEIFWVRRLLLGDPLSNIFLMLFVDLKLFTPAEQLKMCRTPFVGDDFISCSSF